jgi:hypothetical protein
MLWESHTNIEIDIPTDLDISKVKKYVELVATSVGIELTDADCLGWKLVC